MDITDPAGSATIVCGIALLVGIVGTVLPVLPGPVLIAVAVAVWAIIVNSLLGWLALVVVLILLATGAVLKYLTAGRRMIDSGVPNSSLIIAGLVAIVGFFVIPVIGLLIGFLAGLAAAEYLRQRNWDATWRSSVTALKAVGLGMLIEIASAVLSAVVWLGCVLGGALD